MINRKKFFDGLRKLFKTLSPVQVEQATAILDEWERRGLKDMRFLGYYFATNIGECGITMVPVREGFKKTDALARAFVKRQGYRYAKVVRGHVYYGRGRVQLTWEFNYEFASRKLGVDLLNNPDLALDPVIATKIMFDGMLEGWFTKKKLADFFNKDKTDFVNARKIINGLDRAREIAGIAQAICVCLIEAKESTNAIEPA